jgi:hypothetical protein
MSVSLRIIDKWELPLACLQLEELDKMADFYSKLYKQEEPKVEEVTPWYKTFSKE